VIAKIFNTTTDISRLLRIRAIRVIRGKKFVLIRVDSGSLLCASSQRSCGLCVEISASIFLPYVFDRSFLIIPVLLFLRARRVRG